MNPTQEIENLLAEMEEGTPQVFIGETKSILSQKLPNICDKTRLLSSYRELLKAVEVVANGSGGIRDDEEIAREALESAAAKLRGK